MRVLAVSAAAHQLVGLCEHAHCWQRSLPRRVLWAALSMAFSSW